MYDKQISIYCAPTADDRDTWAPSMQHIALEGRCYVLSACQHITRGAFPADFECALGDEPDVVLMRGGSVIVSPHGRSEEHTSELQSLMRISYAVFCLKKK